MNIIEVDGTNFFCTCLTCVGIIRPGISRWADLDGEPWKAYYCHGCVHWKIQEQAMEKPPEAKPCCHDDQCDCLWNELKRRGWERIEKKLKWLMNG